MALPRIITRSLDACQGLNFAGGLFGFGTAVSATTGITLGPVALAFAGASGKQDLKHIDELAKVHGPDWPHHWLVARGLETRGVDHADRFLF